MSPINDNPSLKVELLPDFLRWRDRLKDEKGRALIAARLLRLARGHWGDVKPVGEGVSELRIAHGPGYRLYVTRRGKTWVVVLGGGDKSSQRRDIEKAKVRARELRDAD